MSETSGSAHRWWGVLVPALTFLLGLGLGLVIMVATGGTTEPEADAPEGEESAPTASADPGSDTPDTVVTVPGACEDAAQNISEATRLLDDVAASVRDFQPDELVDLLAQLEELDTETRELAEQCRAVDVTASPSATTTTSESPSESPTS